ncbi:LCP family protein [uncultured Faecalibaculum sp.]|uniref:LCP family glycopolymer transferase n=1 Tax=uncultured Faecalibaculum sp. TaxID=1729681 RepID=UPI0025E0D5A1|nr:LCP family protein [uncultured Faecalibaculum sp.]
MDFLKKQQFWVWLSTGLLAASGLWCMYQLYTLSVLPDHLQLPVLVIIALICLVVILVQLEFAHSKRVRTVFIVIAFLLGAVFSTAAYYLYRTNGTLSAITAIRNTNDNNISVVVMNDSEIHALEDLSGKKVGVLKNIDKGGTEKALEQVQKEMPVEFELVELDSVPQEAMALYNGEVDAVILNEAYRTNVIELEEYADFSNRTRVIFQAHFKTDATNEPLAVSDVTTKPYNILISGNDTYGDVGELSRSDVNMVVTVNPMTSTVLLTSIPRDAYVAVDCGDAYACAEGQLDKITHTGINGVTSTKRTVEKLLDIDINYTFRVNFSSVTNIVDSLGGIDIDVPEGQAVETFYADSTLEGVTEGWNHLDGERALSFARERYAYIDGDNQRVRNQQMVLKAIFDKATSPDIIVNYPSLLKALESAFDTTLSQDEITSFIKYQIQAMPGWKFETYQLSGEGSTLFCPSLGQAAYVTVLDQNTVALAHDKIMAVLDGKDADNVTEPQPRETNDEMNSGYQPGYDSYDDGTGYYDNPEDYYDNSQWVSPDMNDSEGYADPSQDESENDESQIYSAG